MADNGSGTFTVDTDGTPVVDQTEINPNVFNNILAELEAAISNRICKDGQTLLTQNLPMNGKKLTGLTAGTAATDSCNLQNLMGNTGRYVSTVGGTGNAITLTPSPALTSYGAGNEFWFIAANTNTNSVTVNVSALGAKSVTRAGAIALSANDIVAGALIGVMYDGTEFQLLQPYYAEGSWTPSIGGNATYTTQTGRYTKIGRLVHVSCILTINVLGTGSTSVISGLPFACFTTLDQGLTVSNFTSLGVSVAWIGARVDSNASTITLRNTTAAAASATSSALFANSASVTLSGSYYTS